MREHRNRDRDPGGVAPVSGGRDIVTGGRTHHAEGTQAAVPGPARRPSSRTVVGALAGLTALSVLSGCLVFLLLDPYGDYGILNGGIDLDVYREGARRAISGEALYTGPVLAGLLYTYTPFSTLVFIPLGLLPTGDDLIWMTVNLVLLAVVIVQCLHLLGHRIGATTIALAVTLTPAAAFLEPVRTSLFYGQINLALMVLVLWDISRGDKSRLRGIGVGLAAGIKLTPAYFLLYYLAQRRWRAAATGIATVAATIAIAWIVLPSDSYRYWTDTFFNSGRIADDQHAANQSLRGTIARLTGGDAPTVVWLLCAAVIVVVSMAVAVKLLRRGQALAAVTLVGLSAATVSPFSWSHHWVWFVPVLVMALHYALTASPLWWFGVVGWWALLGSWVYIRPDDSVAVGTYLLPATGIWWHPVVNLYTVVYLLVLIGCAVWALRLPAPAPAAPVGAAAPAAPADAPEPQAGSGDGAVTTGSADAD